MNRQAQFEEDIVNLIESEYLDLTKEQIMQSLNNIMIEYKQKKYLK